MLGTTEESSLIELDEGRSKQLLERARREGATVRLIPAGAAFPVEGRIVDLTDTEIELAAEDPAGAARTINAGVACDVLVGAVGHRVCFAAVTHSTALIDDVVHIRLKRPGRVSVRQRRRFWRAAVRPSTSVELTAVDETWSCQGVMLNVSPAGLACLVDRCHADRRCVGDELHARFTLDGGEGAFTVNTEIKAKTPASSPSQIILRLEFSDVTEVRERIGRAIRATPGEPGRLTIGD